MRASSDPTPMKHSNKDGTLSAESAEGRLRLKENTFPLDTYPTQRGTARVPRVGECADRLCLAAMYPREEPDALRSARPDPCGGHRATGVPTAIANNHSALHPSASVVLITARIARIARAEQSSANCLS